MSGIPYLASARNQLIHVEVENINMEGKGFRELDLDIDFVLGQRILFVTRTLFYKKKEKTEENLEPSRKMHCLMLDGSMYQRNQSQKSFQISLQDQSQILFYFFFFF